MCSYKLFRQRYVGDLLDRHRHAEHSRDAWARGGRIGAIRNQTETLRVNPAYRGEIPGKRILVVDDFLTRGYSTEVARNLLLTAGATEVLVATVGKFPVPLNVVSAPVGSWDPFGTSPPAAETFSVQAWEGSLQEEARTEFLKSFESISAESW